jgi:hypothetical protein
MVAISAAVKLAKGYSDRSGIFEVLSQPTVGHILSRIVNQNVPFNRGKLINTLDKLRQAEVLKYETIATTKI